MRFFTLAGRPEVSNRQAALFDYLASGGCLYAYSPETTARLNALHQPKGRTLDVGCGDGVIAAALDGSPVIGLELSPGCAGLARRRGVPVVVSDALAGLPFGDRSFDTVFCIDVLHHLHQRWHVIFHELRRVLSDTGTLVIVEPDARNPFVRWTQAPKSPIRVAPFDDEPAIYPDDLKSELESLGYTVRQDAMDFGGDQVVRDVFPLWQRALKAPAVLALDWICRGRPRKFVFFARKGNVEC